MSLKDNFKQAAKELVSVPQAAKPAADEKGEKEMVPAGDGLIESQNYAEVKEYETTVIGEGVVITGSIQAEGPVDLHGVVKGDIVTKSDFRLGGRLLGNLDADNAHIDGGRMRGNIRVTGHASVDEESVVLGSIKASSMELNGRVKGDLEVKGFLVLGASAVVNGKVTTGRVLIQDGAMCCGELKVTAAPNLEEVFVEIEKDL